MLALDLHKLDESTPEVKINRVILLTRLLGHILHETKNLVELAGDKTVLHVRYVLCRIAWPRVGHIVPHEYLPQAQHFAKIDLVVARR